ncbi:SGNH hydrolase-type esterase domain-containing protein [Blyttiomyces helicus]|uniref:SGNH hydrolase-type esterase domain-containing protein n=1 Tax=Blyttiomyces helicus TaxID=388810 RepID=A0A4P9W863_9FUNG|nr:SGNH hydrolase-type esterase domain-containing protein [Blyttiomyces helicus]|eukprot:RKO86356.1 SGNH hydrolase-type esterase domain-containing protein [Blyttiomyces helicus]
MHFIATATIALIASAFSVDAAGPKLVLAGDSTVANLRGTMGPRQGWGVPGALYFELPVVNLAAAGRSTRSYIRDGHWARVLKSVQFGHNDGAPLVAFGARGTLPGVGNATQTVAVNGVEEVVHTFG